MEIIKVTPQRQREIGARLRRLREHLGFKTQVAFASKIGIASNRFAQYEVGTRLLTIEVALAIRGATGCPLDWMYFGDTHGLPAFLQELAIDPLSSSGETA